jgi:hypothetical protein
MKEERVMHVDCAKKLLEIYIENSIRILDSKFGVDRAESTMFDAIDLLRSYDELKPFFLRKVADSFSVRGHAFFDYDALPEELIELAAHELRWPEFLELADERIKNIFHGDKSLAMGDIATSIRDAYCDDWEDKMFYKRYMSSSACL